MAAPSEPESQQPENSLTRSRPAGSTATKAGGIAIIALAALYSFAAPQLNERFGWNLPAITTDSQGNVRLDDRQLNADSRQRDGTENESNSAPSSNVSSRAESPTASDHDLLYGILKKISRDRYVSPQGLLYTPGSAEGHRLKHLERHTKDQPNRPGKHGVFDGGMEMALKTIDQAFERAQKKQKTTFSKEDGRTIYTVDMGSRVGFIGGQVGRQKRNPMARRVRVVLDGNRVITAFPL